MPTPESAKAKWLRKATREAYAAGIQGAPEAYAQGIQDFAGFRPGPIRMQNYSAGMAGAADSYAKGIAGKADKWYDEWVKAMQK